MSENLQHSNTDKITRRPGFIRSFFRWFRKHIIINLFLLLIIILTPTAWLLWVNAYMPLKYAGNIEGIAITTEKQDVSGNLSAEEQNLVKKIRKLELEKTFMKNRLLLAESDSAYFLLRIPDRELLMEIKGVTVKTCKIEEFQISKRFSRIDPEQMQAWTADPFSLEHYDATIHKIPIVIKQAPKDTIEANQMSSAPIPPDSTAVYITLQFDRELIIEIEQTEVMKESDEEIIGKYLADKRKQEAHEALWSAITFQPPRQPLRMKLRLSADDARAIYRAIPVTGEMVILF